MVRSASLSGRPAARGTLVSPRTGVLRHRSSRPPAVREYARFAGSAAGEVDEAAGDVVAREGKVCPI
jgi:hypothetical protein